MNNLHEKTLDQLMQLLPAGAEVNFIAAAFTIDKIKLQSGTITYRCYAFDPNTGDFIKKSNGPSEDLFFSSKDPKMAVGMMLTWLTAHGVISKTETL